MEKYRETKTTADWNGMLHKLLGNRLYMGILLLTAVCAYGYKVTNVTIGIDDTPSLYYFEEGLIAIVGRWVLFLLNKVISLAEFAPFVTDFAAVLLLIAAAIVWSALFYSVFGEKIPMTDMLIFGSICILSVDQRSIHLFSPQWDSHRISELCSQSVLYEGVAEQYAEAAKGIRSLGEAGMPGGD